MRRIKTLGEMISYTMSYTLGEAAKVVGFSKPTLSRAIKNGTLSAKRLEDKSYQIDPSELERWKETNGHRNTSKTRIKTPIETGETPLSDRGLQAELDAIRQQMTVLDAERDRERQQLTDQIEDLRTRLTKADEERTKLTAILTDERKQPATPDRKGLWARLIG